MRLGIAALLACVVLSSTGPAHAAPPATMSFQGYLTGAGIAPVNGNQAMTFRLYNVVTGGAALWSETQPSVAIAGGIYNVTLGSVTPISLPFDVPYFLGITVGVDAEMTPRLSLSTAGYAFRAAQVDLVVTSSIADGSVTAAKLAPSGCIGGQVLQYNGSAWVCATVSGGGAGTVTSVGTGTGLAGGPVTGAGTIAIAPGGVGPTELASNAVTTVKIANANVTTAKVADANITTAKIADANVTKAKLSAAGGSAGQVLTTDGVSLAWTPPPASLTPLINPLGNVVTTVANTGTLSLVVSIAMGADGVPVISYFDGVNADLKVAKCANAACSGAATITTVDSAGTVGTQSAITVGTDGLPVIAYYDSTNVRLKVAKCANVACIGAAAIAIVDNTGQVGTFTDATLGADGLPVVSYFDFTAQGMRVAKCANAACSGAATITLLDSTAGSSSSIALGADGLPIIAYYDNPNQDLKVAKCTNPACTAATVTTVDSAAGVGLNPSIVLGADGLPVISYYYGSGQALKVAKCVNSACTGASTITIVDNTAAGGAGGYSSMMLGADGLPVIAYHEETAGQNGNVRVAKCANAACTGTATIVTVINNGAVGPNLSMTLGTDGLPVIAYNQYDGTNYHLSVVKCSSPTCQPHIRRR